MEGKLPFTEELQPINKYRRNDGIAKIILQLLIKTDLDNDHQ